MEREEILYLVGQVLGLVTIALGIISYQMKKQSNLLKFKFAGNIVKVFNEMLTGALTGTALHTVGLLKYPIYMIRNKKGKNGIVAPIIIMVLTAITSYFTWTAWYSAFVAAGMIIHAFCMSFKDAQKVRYSLLVTSPMVIVYNAFTYNFTGIIYEIIAIISAIIGIIRFRKARTTESV